MGLVLVLVSHHVQNIHNDSYKMLQVTLLDKKGFNSWVNETKDENISDIFQTSVIFWTNQSQKCQFMQNMFGNTWQQIDSIRISDFYTWFWYFQIWHFQSVRLEQRFSVHTIDKINFIWNVSSFNQSDWPDP